jgi:hypothetical protein
LLLDITQEEVEIRTHGIIHLEHHVEAQDTELEARAETIANLEPQLLEFQGQAPPEPVNPDLREVVVLAVPLRSTAWCTPRREVSCVNHNSSRTRAIALNSNRGNFSNQSHNSRGNSNSSTVLLPHHYSRLLSGRQSRHPATVFRASTVGSWDISLVSA